MQKRKNANNGKKIGIKKKIKPRDITWIAY